MLNKALVFLFLNILSVVCFGQQIDFMLERRSLSVIDSLENKVGGAVFNYNYKISLAKDYVLGVDSFQLANPKVYTRDFKPFNGSVSYFFSLPDSTVRLVEYNWDGEKENEKELRELFIKNKQLIAEKIQDQQPKFKETNTGQDDWVGLQQYWETDKIYITQFIILGAGTYRVRVNISWK
ncbi:hypothetical protein GWR56_12755 [Mucilaginibacter sp. 14171R-50]|uniref:hypothetical protein n=1 Tax=Mucilaginibacter sp. 14171R-50 TaxID=2703789 RepID=UPI00138BA321|nr:hypothetical protein [Mucilaginibacter sp. 14171R-50]QHS56364.1 hypothetical protein GWR56_12755 [Mucilaginibacter sp. 14171R-50]